MMSKPEIRIGLKNETSCLEAKTFLSNLKENASYHEKKDWRHPLGVYSLSVGRVCRKVIKCTERLEDFWMNSSKSKEIKEEITECLELVLYAAAEHVDDIQRISYSFFETKPKIKKSKDVKNLDKSMKLLRDEITSFTNAIKHRHGRIRIFEVEFNHERETITLLGFFIEGFKNGAACPDPILHDNGKTIISVTSFLWDVLTFIAQASCLLCKFLEDVDVVEKNRKKVTDAKQFQEAALKLTQLPLYSFDEKHPFQKVKWVIKANITKPGIYGSMGNPWLKSEKGSFGRFSLNYEGDDSTRSFKIAGPKKMSLVYWTPEEI